MFKLYRAGSITNTLNTPTITDSIAFQLLSDPPGFERKQLPALHQKMADFFKQHATRP